MSNVKYDMNTLANCVELNAKLAVNHFEDEQAYFNRLTEFMEKWSHYLRGYNPTLVVYSPDIRNDFISDIKEIEKFILPLEMPSVIEGLRNVEGAVQNNSAKAISDGLQVFYASLEIASQQVAAARIPDMPADPLPADKPVVLAVDDKPELLTVITSMLQDDYRVISVTSGQAALAAIKRHTPALFLLDIEMPVMDGYELATKIKDDPKCAKKPIIFLTGNRSREHVNAAMALGIDDYVVKPPDKDTLIKKIKGHIQ